MQQIGERSGFGGILLFKKRMFCVFFLTHMTYFISHLSVVVYIVWTVQVRNMAVWSFNYSCKFEHLLLEMYKSESTTVVFQRSCQFPTFLT